MELLGAKERVSKYWCGLSTSMTGLFSALLTCMIYFHIDEYYYSHSMDSEIEACSEEGWERNTFLKTLLLHTEYITLIQTYRLGAKN